MTPKVYKGFHPEVAAKYLEGATIYYTSTPDRVESWRTIFPYRDSSDIHRVSNPEFSFYIQPESFHFNIVRPLPPSFIELFNQIEKDIMKQTLDSEVMTEHDYVQQIAFQAYVQGGLDNNELN